MRIASLCVEVKYEFIESDMEQMLKSEYDMLMDLIERKILTDPEFQC